MVVWYTKQTASPQGRVKEYEMFYINQTLYCPVCEQRIGIRNKSTPFEGLCKECDFYHYFPPHVTIPTRSVARRIKENICNCLTCDGRRQAREKFQD